MINARGNFGRFSWTSILNRVDVLYATAARKVYSGELENGKTLWKVGRVLLGAEANRTALIRYWILLAMLGLSSSICPNHFHDLTAQRFRFHSCVKRPPNFEKADRLRFANNCIFFPFVHSHAQFVLCRNTFRCVSTMWISAGERLAFKWKKNREEGPRFLS